MATSANSWTAQEARELPTFHDASLAVVLETGGYNSTLAPHGAPPSSLPALFSVEPATPACALDVKDAVPSNTAACGSAVTAPFAAMPLCVAYNITGVPGELALNATEAARLFGLGTGPTRAGLRLATTGDGTAVPDAQSLDVVVAASSHTFTAFRRRLAGLTGDASVTSVMASGTIAVSDNAAAVSALGAQTVGRVAVLPAPLATAAGLPCAAFRRETTAGRRTVWTALRATLQPSDARRISVTATDAIGSGDDGSVYPFLEPLFATASTKCRENVGAIHRRDTHFTAQMLARFGDAAFSAHLARWGIVLRPALEMAAVAGLWAQVLCDPPKRVVATGSSAVAPLLTQLALGHLGPTAPLVDYAGVSSGTGLRAVAASTAFFAASESTFSDADFATHPTVQFFPAVALAMAIVAALPGLSSVVVPQCLVPAMFNGTVASWRDPRLVAANPFVLLPDVAVTVAVRAGTSGSTTILTSGLAAIERQCWGGSTFTAGKVWTATLAAGSVTASGTSALLAAVDAVPGRIGYAGHESAAAEGALELQIKPDGGVAVGPSSKAVQVALDAATVDRRRRVTLDVVPGAYPFAGVAYFVINGDLPTSSNCSRYRDSLLFMRELLTGASARAQAEALNYVPLPSAVAEKVSADLEVVQCGGVSLLGPLPTTVDRVPLIASLVAVFVVIVAIVAVLCVYFGLLRHRECPSDPDQPFVAFFVSTKNEEELLEAHGDSALPIFRDLRAIVRTAAGRHGCHVARSLDAHHLVVAKTVEAGLHAVSEIVGKSATLGVTSAHVHATPRHTSAPTTARISHDSRGHSHRYTKATTATESRWSSTARDRRMAADVAVGFAFEHGTIDRTAPDCFAAYGGAAVANAAAFADTAAPGSVVVQASVLQEVSHCDGGESAFGWFSTTRDLFVGVGKQRRTVEVATFHPNDAYHDFLADHRRSSVAPQEAMHDAVSADEQPSGLTPPSQPSSGHRGAYTDGFSSPGSTSLAEAQAMATSALLTALEGAGGAVAVRRVVAVAVEVPALLCAFRSDDRVAFIDTAAAVHDVVGRLTTKARAVLVTAADGRFVAFLGLRKPEPQQLQRAADLAFALHSELSGISGAGAIHVGVVGGRAAAGTDAATALPVVAGTVHARALLLASAARLHNVPVVAPARLVAELPLQRAHTIDLLHWPGCWASHAAEEVNDSKEALLEVSLSGVESIAALAAPSRTSHAEDDTEWMYQLHPIGGGDAAAGSDTLYQRLLAEGPAALPPTISIRALPEHDALTTAAVRSLVRIVEAVRATDDDMNWRSKVSAVATQRTLEIASPFRHGIPVS